MVQGSPKTRLPSIGKVLNLDFIGKPVNAYIYFYEIRLKELFKLKGGLLKPPKSTLKAQSKRDKRSRHIIVKYYIIFIYIYDKTFITAMNI